MEPNMEPGNGEDAETNLGGDIDQEPEIKNNIDDEIKVQGEDDFDENNLHETLYQRMRQFIEEELMNLVEAVEELKASGTTSFEAYCVDEKENVEKSPRDLGADETNFESLIQETKDEIKDLSMENKVLQKRVLALQRRRSSIGTKLFLEGAETQYQICMKQWIDTKEESDRVHTEYDNKIDKLQETVREKQHEARELHKEFSEFKWQVARNAKHIFSGNMLSRKLLDELQAQDLEADVEIERLRIEARQLASQLRKTQQAILKKDQLPCGLFAVDYEQLKIDNESLQEKLAKKMKEIAELGKKTTHNVHALSHFREKLQFVQKEIQRNHKTWDMLKEDLKMKHLDVQRIKIQCEKFQSRRTRMQTFVNIRKPSLLIDMETCNEESNTIEDKIKALKMHHEQTLNHIRDMKSVILKSKSTHPIEPLEKCGSLVKFPHKDQTNIHGDWKWGAQAKFLEGQSASV